MFKRLAMTVDTGLVIAEVKRRPALWDPLHDQYKEREARARCWREVSAAVLYEYQDEKDTRKKKEIEKVVMQRWKTARDAYIRSKGTKNIPLRGGKRKPYVYCDDMKFLDKIHPNSDDVEEVPLQNYATSANQSVSIPISDEEENSAEEIESSSSSDANVQNKRAKSERKRKRTDSNEFFKEMLGVFKENAKMFKNDDLAFFSSLLPITEKFTNHQKLIFRAEILKKAMEIANMPNPYEVSLPGSSNSLNLDPLAVRRDRFVKTED